MPSDFFFPRELQLYNRGSYFSKEKCLVPWLDRGGAVVGAVLSAVIVRVPRFGCCMVYDKVTQ